MAEDRTIKKSKDIISSKKILFIFVVLFVFLSMTSIHAENVTSYSDLSDDISNHQQSVNLTKDYQFDNQSDSDYIEGIEISQDININGNGHIIDGSHQARGLYIEENCNVLIENTTFKNCFSKNNGGAIYLCNNSNLTLKNCIFKGNYVYNANGGAVNCEGSTNTHVYNCIFDNNTSIRVSDLEWVKFKVGMGGAFLVSMDSNLEIYDSTFKNNYGHVSIILVISFDEGDNFRQSTFLAKNCLFENNTSPSHTAIYIDERGKGEISDCVFKNNHVTYMGGTITLESTAYTLIRNCSFEENHVVKGGALNIVPFADYQSTVDIIDCSFLNNYASVNGGAIYANNVKLAIANSTFYNNRAGKNGGAMFLYLGSSDFSNLNFYNNHAVTGGALYIIKNQISLKEGVFYQNRASKNGGAIYDNNAGVYSLNNRFISNSADKGSEVYGDFYVHITQAGSYYNDVNLKIKVISPWKLSNPQKIKIQFSGPQKYATKWINAPSDKEFSFKVPKNLKPGTYDLKVWMDCGICSYNMIKVKVVKAPVKLFAKRITTQYESSKLFKATAKNSKTGKAVSGINFKLKVFTGRKSKVYNVKSDKNGLIKFDTSKLGVGKHVIEISAGDKNVKLSKKAKSEITIKKASARINAPKTVKKHSKLEIKILNKISKKPIKNTRLNVKINYKTFNVKTSSKGILKISSKKLNNGKNNVKVMLRNKNFNINKMCHVRLV